MSVLFSNIPPVVVFYALAGITTVKPAANGPPRRPRFTDVLDWRDGRLQLVAWHSSRIS